MPEINTPANSARQHSKAKTTEALRFRCYRFSLRLIIFLKRRKWDGLSFLVIRQLMRSGLSVGANVIEARNSSTRLEFKRFYEIALKSSNESKYWLCLLRDGFEIVDVELTELLKELNELSKILAASVMKLKKPK